MLVVAACVERPDLFDTARALCQPRDFDLPTASRLFAAVGSLLAEDGGELAPVTIALRADVPMSEVAELVASVGLYPEKGLRRHAAAVRDFARLRKGSTTMRGLATRGESTAGEPIANRCSCASRLTPRPVPCSTQPGLPGV